MNRVFRWLLSFVVTDWSLRDYPLRARRRGAVWTVQVEGWWWMAADGASRREALDRLQGRFEAYAREHPLPRPGEEVSITLGSADDEAAQRRAMEKE